MGKHKYMAWVIGQKRMVRVAGLNFSDPIQIEVPRIGMEEIEGSAWDDPDYFEFWYEGTEAILLKYIGLKDKGGVEIYEGNIVHIWSEYDKGKRVSDEGNWEVFWRNDRWHLRRNGECYDNGDYYEGDECPWPDADNWKPTGSGSRIEVVGNIYENPELLEP